MDVSQYEQTHNMMQVWTGELSELQLPVQNPDREDWTIHIAAWSQLKT